MHFSATFFGAMRHIGWWCGGLETNDSVSEKQSSRYFCNRGSWRKGVRAKARPYITKTDRAFGAAGAAMLRPYNG
jgi:hypothetical protein